jgi:protein TonB
MIRLLTLASVAAWAILLSSTTTYAQDSLRNNGSKTEVFQYVEQMPSFPGGNEKLIDYLVKNIHYPEAAVETKIQGRVIVSFIVNELGKVTDAKVLKSVSPELDAEAVRVVSAMPAWITGKQNGRSVKVRMNLPVSFRLD